jgi:hypothetical protein
MIITIFRHESLDGIIHVAGNVSLCSNSADFGRSQHRLRYLQADQVGHNQRLGTIHSADCVVVRTRR